MEHEDFSDMEDGNSCEFVDDEAEDENIKGFRHKRKYSNKTDNDSPEDIGSEGSGNQSADEKRKKQKHTGQSHLELKRRAWHNWTYQEKSLLCQAVIEVKGQQHTTGNTIWETIYYQRREDFARHTAQSMKEKFRKKLRFELKSYLSEEQISTFPKDIGINTPRTLLSSSSTSQPRTEYDDTMFVPMLNAIAESLPNQSPNTLEFWNETKSKVHALSKRSASALLQQYRLKVKDHLSLWKHMFSDVKFEMILKNCNTIPPNIALKQSRDKSEVEEEIRSTVPVEPVTLTSEESNNVKKLMTGVNVLKCSLEGTNAREKFHAETTFQVLERLFELSQLRQQELHVNKIE